MEGETEAKPAVNGNVEEIIMDKSDPTTESTGQNEENKQPATEVTHKKIETPEKKAPISAHSREQEGHTSARVKEGKRWNERDRHRNGQRDRYTPNKLVRNNNKFDPTSLPESDDPVAICKQVGQDSFIRSRALFTNYVRSNSTSQTPISSRTNSSSPRWKVMKISLFQSMSFTRSSACDTSSHGRLSLLR